MRKTLVASAVWLSIAGLAAAGDATASIRKATHIPAQELGPALKQFAESRDLQVLYFSDTVRNLRSAGAAGEITTDEALTRILSGTGLTYRILDERTITVLPSSASGNAVGDDVEDSAGATATDSKAAQKSSGFWNRFHLAQVDQTQTASDGPIDAQREVASSAKKLELEEVVVTAQKREERLIDAPQSVSVVSSESLTRLGATQFRDFADTVPGVTFQSAGAGNTMIALRGVTSGFDVSPTVGIYVDDVPYGSSTAFAKGSSLALDVGLFNLDRIEVLRGPQGTLYGASTMGGLIKYVTERPSSTQFEADVQTGMSNTQSGGVSYNGALAVNTPLVENKAGMRVSGFYTRDGGYIDNVALGKKDVNEADIYGGRLDLLFTPSDALTLRFNGFTQDISRDGQATVDYTFAGEPVDGALVQRRLIPETFDQRFRLVGGTVDYDFGSTKLTSISSYQTAKSLFYNDLSTTFIPLLAGAPFNLQYSATGYLQHQTTEKYTQELRLASDSTTAALPLEWLIGGYYTRERSTNEQGFTRLYDAAGNLSENIVGAFSGPSRYRETAAFANLTYHLTSQFDVSGGLRYAENRQVLTQFGSGFLFRSFPPNRSSESVVTYLANARYKFNAHATGYLRYATGFRPGGPNFVISDPVTGELIAPPTYDSDSLKSYEVGFKAETSDRRLGMDVALYTIDWQDMQVIALRGGLSVYANAQEATIRGTELTVAARPIESLMLTGTFAYQDAELAKASLDLGGAKGEQLPNVPRTSASINADYELRGLELQPTFGATVRYVSDRNTSFNQSFLSPQYRLPEYTIVDLRAGVSIRSVNVQLYVHNLFQEHAQLLAPTLASSFNGPMFLTTLQPRTIGLTATARF